MPRFLFLLFVLSVQNIHGQIKYEINDFEPGKFKAEILPENNPGKVFKKGTISIIDLKENKPIIRISSEELLIDVNNNTSSGIVEVPYNKQELIIYDDFNFDGHKDFALMDGQLSCYHGPSYKIYLWSPGGFVYNPDFSKLAHEYCGMFMLDKKVKRLYTMSKSGYFLHQNYTFKVIDNKPVLIQKIETDFSYDPYEIYRLTTIKNGKAKTKTTKTLITDFITPIFSFQLKKSHKKVLLFEYNNQLNFCIIKPDKEVILAYPFQHPGNFKISTNKTQITFMVEDVKYILYEDNKSHSKAHAGIIILSGNKKKHLKAKPSTIRGTLTKLKSETLTNLQPE